MNWALQEICITLGSEIMKEKKAKQNFCSCILNAYSPAMEIDYLTSFNVKFFGLCSFEKSSLSFHFGRFKIIH